MVLDKHNFSRESWVDFKKNWGGMEAKDLPFGRFDFFQTGPSVKVSSSALELGGGLCYT